MHWVHGGKVGVHTSFKLEEFKRLHFTNWSEFSLMKTTCLSINIESQDTYLSTSTFGSAFIAASRTLGNRWGSAGGENGLLGLLVMYWGDAFLNSPVVAAYVTRLGEVNESLVACSSIAENTWFWLNVTIFGDPGSASSSLISSGTMSAGCGDRGGELGSGLDVSTVCVAPTGAKDTTETTWREATASSVSWAITLSVCSITCDKNSVIISVETVAHVLWKSATIDGWN